MAAIGAVALVAAIVGAVTSGGVILILLPALVVSWGVHEAVPIVTVALLVASVSRVLL